MPGGRREHPFDSIADELVQWLDEEPTQLAEAMRGGYATPFAAGVSELDKLRYYQRQVFESNPDGSINFDKPNKEGRDALIKQIGIPGFTQVMTGVLASRRAMDRSVTGPDFDATGETGESYDG